MLLAGDEMGRSQQGNNNTYCQDTSLSWHDWTLDVEQDELLNFVRRLIALRKNHNVFRRRHFFQGRPIKGTGGSDIIWPAPTGAEMTDGQWQHSFARCLGLYLAGDALEEQDEKGNPVVDNRFLLLVNAHHESISFTIPDLASVRSWQLILDTSWSKGGP